MVARLQINITEVFGPCDLIKEVIDSGNRVSVSDSDFIQSPVINTESPGSRKVMSWGGCAPCGVVLGSIA